MPIMNPRVNINGTSQQDLVDQRRKIMDALMGVMEAMGEAKPHMRDYPHSAAQYELDRQLWTERFAAMDKLRNEIMDEALQIHGGN